MRGNTDFHHNFQLWFLCRNDGCSTAVLKRAVRNNLHYLSTINGNYGAMKHSSLQSINLRWVFFLSSEFLGGLCPHSPSTCNFFSATSLNTPVYLYLELTPNSSLEGGRIPGM